MLLRKWRGGNFLPPERVLNPASHPVSDDDASLIDETLNGQSEAFGRLVLRYQDRLYNTVFHIVGHAEDAADIVQETFVQAFLKLKSFQRRSEFYTWLYRIALNAAVSERRRRRPTVSLDAMKSAADVEPTSDSDGPSELWEQKERCGVVRAAIAALDEEFRTVLVLREIDGRCYEEIAAILDVPVGTVRSRLHRARVQLKEKLNKNGE
jgi:RNA polymerase sigma-70 factor, ECF subfamily